LRAHPNAYEQVLKTNLNYQWQFIDDTGPTLGVLTPTTVELNKEAIFVVSVSDNVAVKNRSFSINDYLDT
jgi:hypothetical protein